MHQMLPRQTCSRSLHSNNGLGGAEGCSCPGSTQTRGQHHSSCTGLSHHACRAPLPPSAQLSFQRFHARCCSCSSLSCRDPEPFDWYQRYAGLKDLVGQYIRKSDAILMSGCGNSSAFRAGQKQAFANHPDDLSLHTRSCFLSSPLDRKSVV